MIRFPCLRFDCSLLKIAMTWWALTLRGARVNAAKYLHPIPLPVSHRATHKFAGFPLPHCERIGSHRNYLGKGEDTCPP